MPPDGGGFIGDAQALAADLRAHVQGEVRFDDGSRALYATDASNYRQVPIGVVIPRTVQDVIETVAACRRHGAPVLSRGGGTSLCGQTCNVAVVIDFTKHLNQILEIDAEHGWARVQPGVVLDDLRDQANKVGLTFAPDPATHTHNTLGGMLGNNSCGPHSIMGGETVHNVIDLDVLLYDGTRISLRGDEAPRYERLMAKGGRAAEVIAQLRELGERHAQDIRDRYPPIPRRVSGFNLPALLPGDDFDVARALVGSEGTCVVILEARVRLLPNPKARSLLVLGYPDVYSAGDHVPQVMASGPIALEGLDDKLVEDMRVLGLHTDDIGSLPTGQGWLLVEYGGDTKQASDDKARALMAQLKQEASAPNMVLLDDPAFEQRIWKVRESGLGATAHVPNQRLTWEGWEDSSVPPERLGEYLRKLQALFKRYQFDCTLYGHFGQGCVHTRIQFDLETAEGVSTYRRFIHEAAELVTSLGGSVSGEHGDGQSKAELLPIMFGERLIEAFRDFKRIWDPQGKMNPGKIVDAYRADENLRLGTSYNPKPVKTMFFFRQDEGDFGRTMLRCVGVGECRKHKGTMCPSYMATGEEMHSTRGRAHLLFEMLNGDRPEGVLKKGWNEEAVKQSLDLCLSCKGCKHECPVSVDMASYKAEFLHHYYQRHARPASAWAFGHIDRWARLASHAPRIANALTQTDALARVGKALIGIAPQRRLPVFAPRTFLQDFARRGPASPGIGQRGEVILWADTFNNHFHPQVAHAAVDVLERAGFRVRVPPSGLCCGRPLYEFGLLDAARRKLAHILKTLGEDIAAGVPIVGLEPACVSVFKEEMLLLFNGDEQAKRLSQQVFMLSDFLAHAAPDLAWTPLRRKALVHGHCHHKTVLGFDAETRLLDKLGLQIEAPDTGCCGMAGSFGFEKDKYDVSMRCGERVLLPAVRAMQPEALVISNGYSCREQITQTTDRHPLHLAEVLKMALPPSN
jgi:FAD/FMN-containing dehydrogenase/Fe-S oxidoreductase